jgi:hypothetical protein
MRCRAALLVVAACGGGHGVPPDSDVDAGPGGLPCDVRAVLEDACAQCHADPVTSNAPHALVARSDFFAASSVDGESLGMRSLARLHDTSHPMPPLSEPPASAAQLATLGAWLSAGMPGGTCGQLPMRPATPTCASGAHWTGAATSAMNPGKACLGCHTTQAPHFAYFFMGTAFPAYHEGDDCEDPPPAGARVEILDSDGNVTLTLVPTADGNFYSTTAAAGVPLPFTARLVANGLARAMTTPQMSGDCNACHTEQGTTLVTGTASAPGRLVWPRPRP